MNTTREQILIATCTLLEAQGFHGTGLNQIISTSGAPRGSLYYHFPDGKDGLAAEAIARTGALTAQRISQGLHSEAPIPQALRAFIEQIADLVERSGFRAGGPLTTVAMETATTNERLNAACRAAFQQLEGAFAQQLHARAIPLERATTLATFITASIEGGIILSRTYHTGDPLRRVAQELERLLQSEERSQ
jgi:TetR/AcrR family transcriptional repressor of lmrAB and yxaGH operons